MASHPYITCKQLIDFILDYVEGTLPEAERQEFERHLKACPSCVAYLDGYKRTIELGRAALNSGGPEAGPEGPPPAGLIEAVRAARKRAE